jgi:hypothetical protein
MSDESIQQRKRHWQHVRFDLTTDLLGFAALEIPMALYKYIPGTSIPAIVAAVVCVPAGILLILMTT